MFEKASRQNLTFKSAKGVLTVTDLWTARLTTLNEIAIAVNKAIQSAESESFINVSQNSAKVKSDILRLDILKHIIKVRQQEAEDAESMKKDQQFRQEIHAALAEKQKENLRNLSEAELKALLDKQR